MQYVRCTNKVLHKNVQWEPFAILRNHIFPLGVERSDAVDSSGVRASGRSEAVNGVRISCTGALIRIQVSSSELKYWFGICGVSASSSASVGRNTPWTICRTGWGRLNLDINPLLILSLILDLVNRKRLSIRLLPQGIKWHDKLRNQNNCDYIAFIVR